MEDLFIFIRTLPDLESQFAFWYGLITYIIYVSGILGRGGDGNLILEYSSEVSNYKQQVNIFLISGLGHAI